MALYDIYPVTRKLVLDTFDKKGYNITRTQLNILLTLSVDGTMNMSALAGRINTSNEQATRAVGQLAEKGLITKEHSEDNRRIVNISLTDKAHEFLTRMKTDITEAFAASFSELTDEEIEQAYESIGILTRLLKKVIE